MTTKSYADIQEMFSESFDLAGILVSLAFITLFFSTLLIRHFASPGTSFNVQAIAIISFALGFYGIALLPIDLSLTTDLEDNDNSNIVNATYLPWQMIYWLTFIMAFAVLPITGRSLLSGEFTESSRMRDAFRQTIFGHLIIVVLFVVFVVSLAIKLHTINVIPVLMAIGNTYGLLLISLLLGYGLIAVPRYLWRQYDPVTELRRVHIMVGSADEALFEAVWQLQDCEKGIEDMMTILDDYSGEVDAYHRLCIDELLRRKNETLSLSRDLQQRRTNSHRLSEIGDSDNSDEGYQDTLTVKKISQLNARMKFAQEKLISAEQRWETLVARSIFLTDLINGPTPPSPQIVDTSAPLLNTVKSHFQSCGAKINYYWKKYARSTTYRFAAIYAAVLSGTVLWSEATLSLSFNLSPFAIFLRFFNADLDGEGKGILFKIAALIPFLYMSVCVYSSLIKLSGFGTFTLRGHKQSHGVALLFSAQYLVRLQFPLGYNYLLMLKYDTSSTTCAFSNLMSNMSTVPFLGTSFSVYAPLLILCLCGFTLCNGYPRLVALLGFEHEDGILMGNRETLESKVSEGITLLRRHAEKNEFGNDRLSSLNSVI